MRLGLSRKIFGYKESNVTFSKQAAFDWLIILVVLFLGIAMVIYFGWSEFHSVLKLEFVREGNKTEDISMVNQIDLETVINRIKNKEAIYQTIQ